MVTVRTFGSNNYHISIKILVIICIGTAKNIQGQLLDAWNKVTVPFADQGKYISMINHIIHLFLISSLELEYLALAKAGFRKWCSGITSASRTKGLAFESQDEWVLLLVFSHANGASVVNVSMKQELNMINKS